MTLLFTAWNVTKTYRRTSDNCDNVITAIASVALKMQTLDYALHVHIYIANFCEKISFLRDAIMQLRNNAIVEYAIHLQNPECRDFTTCMQL